MMPVVYVPPCVCEVPDDIDDPGAHLPACPHFDPAHDAATIGDEPRWPAPPTDASAYVESFT